MNDLRMRSGGDRRPLAVTLKENEREGAGSGSRKRPDCVALEREQLQQQKQQRESRSYYCRHHAEGKQEQNVPDGAPCQVRGRDEAICEGDLGRVGRGRCGWRYSWQEGWEGAT